MSRPRSTRRQSTAVRFVSNSSRSARQWSNGEEAETAPVAPPLVDGKGLQILHICYSEAGITERTEKLLYAVSVINRPIESSKELTAEEAYLIRKSLTALVNTEGESENQGEPVPGKGREPVSDSQPDNQPSYKEGWGTEEPPY